MSEENTYSDPSSTLDDLVAAGIVTQSGVIVSGALAGLEYSALETSSFHLLDDISVLGQTASPNRSTKYTWRIIRRRCFRCRR